MFALPHARSLLAACRPTLLPHAPSPLASPPAGVRFRSQLAPKRVKYLKRHKNLMPIPIGGSTKGTTLAYGEYGIRIKENGMRLTAKQLMSAEEAIRRAIKPIKGAKVYLRVFPDIPVCIKFTERDSYQGNETRMGKGKGAFEYWATGVAPGRVIFEIGGAPMRPEIARQVLRLGSAKLPTIMEFITKDTPPRLGNLVLPKEEFAKLDCTPYTAP
ncbi:mitochondrial ribosomal protein L16 [Fomitopsis betulina]|nr:mitochondrial ribosomal protein L16 [Fomitopsis betulina]